VDEISQVADSARTPTHNNLAAIQRVPEAAGVEFTNGDAPGVRLRKKKR
jgi:hypothetical protein